MPRKWDGFRLLLFLAMAVYVLIFASLAFDLHAGMRTHKSDLGQMDQALWNTSRGRFVETIQDETLATRMTDHVEPIFLLISPVLWLWDDVRALLWVQVLAAALGAWPLFELARRKIGRVPALVLGLAYLLDPHLQSAILTEFHAIPLAVPLILWAFWAIEARRWGQFAAAALLVAGVKEEAALLAAGLGLWALWQSVRAEGRSEAGKQSPEAARDPAAPPKVGRPPFVSHLPALAVILISLLWFYLTTFVIVPAHALAAHGSAKSVYFARYGALGDSPLDIFASFFARPEVVWQIATEPARVNYLVGLLGSFGFLSLLAPEILLLALPVLLANHLSAYAAQYYGEFHYSAPLVPYFAVAALYGFNRVAGGRASKGPGAGNHRRRAARLLPAAAVVLLLFTSGLYYVKYGRGPLGGRYDPAPITAHHRLLPRFTAQIPAEAAVSATAAVHPHLSHRRFIYQFPLGLDAAAPAEWALLDVTTNTDMAPGDLRDAVLAMLADNWGVVDAANGFLLMQRGAANKQIPEAFYTFVRTAATAVSPDGGVSLPLVFTGLEAADWPRWRQTKIVTRWQVGAAYQPGAVRPWLELRTPAGERIYTFDDLAPPALVWLPPERWRPGDLITIETLALSLPRYWAALTGVVHGPDPTAAADRLPAELFMTEPTLALSADRTLALAGVFARDQQGRVQILSTGIFPPPSWGEDGLIIGPDHALPFQTWLAPASTHTARPGSDLHMGIRWGGSLPAGYVPFVHLRQDGATIAQDDGPPQRFVPLAGEAEQIDWRTLTIPTGLQPETLLEIFFGVYNPTTGQRLEITLPDGQPLGSEILRHTHRVARPSTPDQACALIPSTCGSQP